MRLPRAVSAGKLIRALEGLGYRVVRQKGSHVRLRHDGPPAHSISIPRHDSLKIGTLHGILAEVAQFRAMSTETLAILLA